MPAPWRYLLQHVLAKFTRPGRRRRRDARRRAGLSPAVELLMASAAAFQTTSIAPLGGAGGDLRAPVTVTGLSPLPAAGPGAPGLRPGAHADPPATGAELPDFREAGYQRRLSLPTWILPQGPCLGEDRGPGTGGPRSRWCLPPTTRVTATLALLRRWRWLLGVLHGDSTRPAALSRRVNGLNYYRPRCSSTLSHPAARRHPPHAVVHQAAGRGAVVDLPGAAEAAGEINEFRAGIG
jgi:hypothetical protein